MFWMRFTMSRAIPSLRSSSVIVTSRATVILPSLATCHPGNVFRYYFNIGKLNRSPDTVDVKLHRAVTFQCGDIDPVTWSLWRRQRSSLPFRNFGPSFLKSGLTRFTSTPSSLPTYFMVFTFTSLSIKSAIDSIISFCASSSTGIINVDSG